MKRSIFIVLMLTAIMFNALVISPATAAPQKNNISETIIKKYKNAAAKWSAPIKTVSQWLFWRLAIINLAWIGIQLSLKNGGIGDWARELIKFIMVIGFFYWLLDNGADFMLKIIASFTKIASLVPNGSEGFTPSTFLEKTFKLFLDTTNEFGWFSSDAWIIGVGALAILAFGILISAQIVVAMIKGYVALYMGTIAMGFGGSVWTKDFVVNYIKMVVATGMSLMALQLLAALGLTLFNDWIAVTDYGLESTFSVVIGLVILFLIMKEIPGVMSTVVFGTQMGSGSVNVLGTAAAMTAAMATGGAMAAKAFTAGVKGTVVAGMAAKMQGSTVGNIAKAASTTFKSNIGQPKNQRRSLMGGAFNELTKMKQELARKGPGESVGREEDD